MRKITIREKEVDVKDNWDEITLEKYGKILELYAGDNSIEEKFLIEFICIITDLEYEYLMGLYDDDIFPFVEIMNEFNKDGIVKKECKTFDINGKVYVANKSSRLTLGEKISIKLLEKTTKNTWDSAVNLLAILIRPGVEKTDELGNIYYEAEPFVGDIDTITRRKDLIKDIPATAALWVLEDFTPGRD
jgi:hypothetical protein